MELKIFIDKEHSEEVIVWAHERTKLVEDIEQLVLSGELSLIGYKENEVIKLNLNEIYCFMVEDNRVFALTENERAKLKSRLYKIEEKLPKDFIKINQSCIVNIKKIERFDASISGTLTVILKNGYSDYVSRRNLKNIKERLGF